MGGPHHCRHKTALLGAEGDGVWTRPGGTRCWGPPAGVKWAAAAPRPGQRPVLPPPRACATPLPVPGTAEDPIPCTPKPGEVNLHACLERSPVCGTGRCGLLPCPGLWPEKGGGPLGPRGHGRLRPSPHCSGGPRAGVGCAPFAEEAGLQRAASGPLPSGAPGHGCPQGTELLSLALGQKDTCVLAPLLSPRVLPPATSRG